jgi:hypothetical protein
VAQLAATPRPELPGRPNTAAVVAVAAVQARRRAATAGPGVRQAAAVVAAVPARLAAVVPVGSAVRRK